MYTYMFMYMYIYIYTRVLVPFVNYHGHADGHSLGLFGGSSFGPGFRDLRDS